MRQKVRWPAVPATFAPEGKTALSRTPKRHARRFLRCGTAAESAKQTDKAPGPAAREANRRRTRCTTAKIRPWPPPHLPLRTRPPGSSIVSKAAQLELARNRHRNFGVQQHVRVLDFGMQHAPERMNECQGAAFSERQPQGKGYYRIDGKSSIHAPQQFFDAFARKTRDQHGSAVCSRTLRVAMVEQTPLLRCE